MENTFNQWGTYTESLISPSGNHFVTYDRAWDDDNENYLNLYSIDDTSPIWDVPNFSIGNQPEGVKFSADSSKLVIGTYNGTVWTGPGDQTIYAGKTYLYDIVNESLVWQYTDNSRNNWPAYDFSQNGDIIAKCDFASENITIFNSISKVPIWQHQTPGSNCRDISVSADGSIISATIIHNEYGAVYWWNLNSNIPVKIHNFSNGIYIQYL